MSHIIAIDLNPLEVEFDPEVVRDASELLFGTGERGAFDVENEFRDQLQDAVIDAVATVIRNFEAKHDFIIRVEQPKVPPVPLVKSITTVPF